MSQIEHLFKLNKELKGTAPGARIRELDGFATAQQNKVRGAENATRENVTELNDISNAVVAYMISYIAYKNGWKL